MVTLSKEAKQYERTILEVNTSQNTKLKPQSNKGYPEKQENTKYTSRSMKRKGHPPTS